MIGTKCLTASITTRFKLNFEHMPNAEEKKLQPKNCRRKWHGWYGLGAFLYNSVSILFVFLYFVLAHAILYAFNAMLIWFPLCFGHVDPRKLSLFIFFLSILFSRLSLSYDSQLYTKFIKKTVRVLCIFALTYADVNALLSRMDFFHFYIYVYLPKIFVLMY